MVKYCSDYCCQRIHEADVYVYNSLAENEILHRLFVLGPSRTWYQSSVGSWYVLPLAGVLRRYVIIRRSNNLFASVVLVRSTDYLSR